MGTWPAPPSHDRTSSGTDRNKVKDQPAPDAGIHDDSRFRVNAADIFLARGASQERKNRVDLPPRGFLLSWAVRFVIA